MAGGKRVWSQGWWEDNVSDGELARMMELYEDDFLEDVSYEELLCMEKEEPCNAFFGARPGAMVLHHRMTDVKQIRFVDVTSECPGVNKNGLYPLGHPIILYEPENQDPSVYNGLLKVDVLPLAELFHSVLPYRHKMSSGSYKLTLPFCAKCVEEESIKPMLARSFICSHTDSEQCLRAMACLKLYESLERVQQQVLYYDTDSVVCRWKPGDPEILLGDHLGEMTNELDEGDWMEEFVCAGAKNYGYQTPLGH
ncbi:hypothetical protein AWC38_SpisGene17386, partial [Stylophora pistillata]